MSVWRLQADRLEGDRVHIALRRNGKLIFSCREDSLEDGAVQCGTIMRGILRECMIVIDDPTKETIPYGESTLLVANSDINAFSMISDEEPLFRDHVIGDFEHFMQNRGQVS